jgi:Cu+-exporting ATPase
MNSLFWILLLGLGLWWLFRVTSRMGGGRGTGMGGGCCGGGGQSHHGSHSQHSSSHHAEGREISEAVVDPVCRMAVDTTKTAHTLSYGGTTYHFCSSDCYETFKADPEKFLLTSKSAG